jgi:hypothetical protein
VLNQLQKELKGQVLVVGIDFDASSPDAQRAIKEQYAIDYSLMQGPLTQVSMPWPKNVPTTYIFTPQDLKLYSIFEGALAIESITQGVHDAQETR